MPFSKVVFNTMDEFYALMQKDKLNFILFASEGDIALAGRFALQEDEVGFYVNAEELSGECFEKFMKTSFVERRAWPWLGEIKPTPYITSFMGGVGFINTYFHGQMDNDLESYLYEARAEKKIFKKLFDSRRARADDSA